MQIFILDPDTADEIKRAGYALEFFNDVNGTPIWEFSYEGDNIDIGDLVKKDKIIVNTCPKTIYL